MFLVISALTHDMYMYDDTQYFALFWLFVFMGPNLAN